MAIGTRSATLEAAVAVYAIPNPFGFKTGSPGACDDNFSGVNPLLAPMNGVVQVMSVNKG